MGKRRHKEVIMTEVRCGFTNCKHNKQSKDGYFCTAKKIHIYSYTNSHEREKGEQMKCDRREVYAR